jgi:hypothetical protein
MKSYFMMGVVFMMAVFSGLTSAAAPPKKAPPSPPAVVDEGPLTPEVMEEICKSKGKELEDLCGKPPAPPLGTRPGSIRT